MGAGGRARDSAASGVSQELAVRVLGAGRGVSPFLWEPSFGGVGCRSRQKTEEGGAIQRRKGLRRRVTRRNYRSNNLETKQRSLDTLLWGMVPYWSKDGKTGFINARAERIDTAPAFRRPFHKRRCLIPATGFYEWKKTPEGKIPYSIEMKDSSPFVFAGLWDGWQNADTKEWLRSCVIITGEPNELVGQIHNRMPSFCRRRPTSNGFQERPEKKSCDRSLRKKWLQDGSPNGSINQKIMIPAS
jgi:putative SOS response-associated peptidase YedK